MRFLSSRRVEQPAFSMNR